MKTCFARSAVQPRKWGIKPVFAPVARDGNRGVVLFTSRPEQNLSALITNRGSERQELRSSPECQLEELVYYQRKLELCLNDNLQQALQLTLVTTSLFVFSVASSPNGLMNAGALLWQLYSLVSSTKPWFVKHRRNLALGLTSGFVLLVELGCVMVEMTGQGDIIAALYIWFCNRRIQGAADLGQISPFLSSLFDLVCEGFDLVLRKSMLLVVDWMLFSLNVVTFVELGVLFGLLVWVYQIGIAISQRGLSAWFSRPTFPTPTLQSTAEFGLVYAIVLYLLRKHIF